MDGAELQRWMDAHTVMTFLYPYVEPAISKARRTGGLGFEVRVRASLVFGLYRVLCDFLQIEEETDPSKKQMVWMFTDTLRRVREIEAQPRSQPEPKLGRRRKGNRG